jgi:hypothetical protein
MIRSIRNLDVGKDGDALKGARCRPCGRCFFFSLLNAPETAHHHLTDVLALHFERHPEQLSPGN